MLKLESCLQGRRQLIAHVRTSTHSFQVTIQSRPARVYLTSKYICIEYPEKAFNHEFKRTEMTPFTRIDDVTGGSVSLSEQRRQLANPGAKSSKPTKPPTSSQANTVVITFAQQSAEKMKIQTPAAHHVASALCTAIIRLKQQQALEVRSGWPLSVRLQFLPV